MISFRSKQGATKAINRELNERSLETIDYNKQSPVWKHNITRIQGLGLQEETLEQDKLSIEQFLNLSKNASAKVNPQMKLAKIKSAVLSF